MLKAPARIQGNKFTSFGDHEHAQITLAHLLAISEVYFTLQFKIKTLLCADLQTSTRVSRSANTCKLRFFTLTTVTQLTLSLESRGSGTHPTPYSLNNGCPQGVYRLPDNESLTTADVNNVWSFNSAPPYVFMVLCLDTRALLLSYFNEYRENMPNYDN